MNKKIKQTVYTLLALTAFTFASSGCTNVEEVTSYTATVQGNPTHNVGKSVFQVKIADGDGNGVSGLNPQILPVMDMGGMVHATPVDSVTDDGGGLYTAVVYYLMPGSWEIKILDSNSVEIAAKIPVTVGGTMMQMASISDSADQYDKSGTPTNRPYFIFIEEITGTSGNHTVKIFAAVRKSMMEHPALKNGLTLSPASGPDWIVNGSTTSIDLSLDSGTTWLGPLTDNGAGHFAKGSIAGLAAGSQTLTFKLTVNTTVYTKKSLIATVP